ncbi:MAG: endonuclease/exonuclease/phosphatase family protein, partial [Rhodobacteraceae bacterium]|nr:endonuclease/exonuclease/phosphatase family protein [Paracoccaceae bacterium]
MKPLGLLLALLMAWPLAAQERLRVATFNVGLGRNGPGLLLKDIEDRDSDILALAKIIASVAPDILLITGFDNDYQLRALRGFNALKGLGYPHIFAPLGNAGLQSGLDINGNGRQRDWNDAWGFGRFEGSEGMALLSRFPIQNSRSFDTLLWNAFGPAPRAPDGTEFFTHWPVLRLASHSLWDVEFTLPSGPLHILAAH